MKKFLQQFLFFLLCFVAFRSDAQKATCGVYVKPKSNNISNTGGSNAPKYSDRFGNLYLEDELIIPTSIKTTNLQIPSLACNLTKFKLTYIGSFTNAQQEIICEAFKEVENKISIKNPINIQISKTNTSGEWATASDYYNTDDKCSVKNTYTWKKANLNYNNPYLFDGYLYFNSNVTDSEWFTDINGKKAGVGQVDMYTVTLHQILHILGVDSQINSKNTNPFLPTAYDKYLKRDGKSLIVSANDSKCCGLHKINVDLNGIFTGCSNSQIIFTGNNNLNVNTFPFSNSDAFNLSHLCDKKSPLFADYKMNEDRLFIDDDELDILCKIGYEVKNQSCVKNECIIQANDDIFYIYDPSETKLSIDEYALLSNDVYLLNKKISIVGLPTNGASVTIIGTKLDFSNLKNGDNIFTYQIEGCDGFCSRATFNIYIKYELKNCPPDFSCNLVCNGDFEDPTQFEAHKDFLINNSTNTPDYYKGSNTSYKNKYNFCSNDDIYYGTNTSPNTISSVTPNSYFFHLASNSINLEGIVLKLNTNLLDKKRYRIRFDRFSGCSNTVNFAFSNTPPCPKPTLNQSALIGNPLTSTPCSGSGTFQIPQIVPFPYVGNTTSWIPSSVDFIADDRKATYLIIYQNLNWFNVPGPPPYPNAMSLFLDNIEIVPISDAGFTVEETCPFIKIKANETGGTHLWTITNSAGVQVASNSGVYTQIPFNQQFPNGTYKITHQINGLDCGGSDIVEETVTIKCLACECPTQNGLKIFADPNGTTLSSLINSGVIKDVVIDKDVHNNCLGIDGKLIIDTDAFILGCQNVVMQPCAEIVVQKGVTLVIDQNIIYGCKQMWKGITVEEGGKLTFLNNVISDAQHAISVTGSRLDDYPNILSSILVKNNRFEKNHIGVNVNGRFDGTTRRILNHTPFIDNTFIGSGVTDLLPPCTKNLANYSAKFGYAGMMITNISMTIGTPQDKKTTNTFSALRNGILSSDNTLQVYNASFNGLDVAGYWVNEQSDPLASNSFGVAILSNKTKATVANCIFNKCGHGVFANTSILSVKNCNMPEVFRGVEFVNGVSITVSDNKTINYINRGIIGRELSYSTSSSVNFNINRNEIKNIPNPKALETVTQIAIEMKNKVSGNLKKARIFKNIILLDNKDNGIDIKLSSQWTIDENHVKYENIPTQNQSGSGVAYRFEGGGKNYLYDNFAEDVATKGNSVGYRLKASQNNDFCCNRAEGNQSGLYIENGCNNTNLRTTTFTKHQFCLNYSNGTAITGNQTNRGNIFNISAGKAKHIGAKSIVDQSIFTVKNTSTPEHPIGIDLPGATTTKWFETNLLDGLKCKSCTVPPIAPLAPEISDLDLFVIKEGFGNKTITTRTLQWESERGLYERIYQNASLLGINDEIDNFYFKSQNEKLGQYFTIDNDVNRIFENTEEIDTKLEELLFRIDDVNETADNEYFKFKEAITFEDSLKVYNDAEKIRIGATPHDYHLGLVFEEITNAQKEKAANVAVSIDEIKADDILTQNRKSILAIYAKNIANNSDVLSGEDLEMVSSIAHQCLAEGGEAVLMARVMYSAYDTKIFDDEQLCKSGGTASKIVKNTNFATATDFEIVPNPAQTEANIIVANPIKSAFDIILTDMTGITIKTISKTSTDSNIYTFYTSELPSGIYFCHLKMANGFAITKKLIIQK